MLVDESDCCHWVGVSLQDVYPNGKTWASDSVPPVSASKFHKILYELPALGTCVPKPHFGKQDVWDSEHVRMPHSAHNLFPVNEVLKSRWEIIQCSLLQPIRSSGALQAAISSYNTNLPKFLALHYFFEEVLEEEESAQFFENILPGIVNLALQLPDLIPSSIPLLKQGATRSISLSQMQVACLLANAFLCTFPWRKESAASYPGANFVRLFAAHLRPKRVYSVSEKLKCIIHYFRRVLTKAPVGIITLERKYLSKYQMPRWDNLQFGLGDTKVHISGTGTIENNGLGCLQVDFANKFVGGGVLGFGCVQEEIRFVICPELIVSRLFVEQLGPTEALVVTGAERYSNYTGYGDTFTWAGNHLDETPYDSSFRRKTSIVAIDATRFSKPNDQYFPSAILRELNKAYAGFHSRMNTELTPVATGNWGCGAFRGDVRLKFLIQLIACRAALRNMIYFTFDNIELRDELYEMYSFLKVNGITINQLWRYLCNFAKSKVLPSNLYLFVHQAHFNFTSNIPQMLSNVTESTVSINDDIKPSTSSSNSHKKPLEECPHRTKIRETNEVENIELLELFMTDDEDDLCKKDASPSETNNGSKVIEDIANSKKAIDGGEDIVQIMNYLAPREGTSVIENRTEVSTNPFRKGVANSAESRHSYCQLPIEIEKKVVTPQVATRAIEDRTELSRNPFRRSISNTKTKITDYFAKASK